MWHVIRELQILSETLSANSIAAVQFKETFQSFLEDEELTRDDVYNAGETVLNQKSLAFSQESAVRGFKVLKETVAAMKCANSGGAHTLSFLLIGIQNR